MKNLLSKEKAMLLGMYVLLLMSFIFFYSETRVSNLLFIKVLLFSWIIASLLYSIIYYMAPIGVGIFLYGCMNLIMWIDVLYYRYFNSLPTVHQAGMLGELKEALNSVFPLIRLEDSLFILLPVLTIVFYIVLQNSSLSQNREWKQLKSSRKKILTTAFISLSAIILVLKFQPDTFPLKTQLKSVEFFTYHITDLLNNPGEQEFQQIKANKNTYDPLAPYFGMGQDKNVVIIQMESLQNFVINKKYNGQWITPHLNGLIENSIYFDNYYQQLGKGNTSDAEFVSLNSLYPVLYGQSYTTFVDNTFYGLPWVLKDRGYDTAMSHGNHGSFYNRDIIYEKQGFNRFYDMDTFRQDELYGFGLTDKSFFKQSVEKLQQMNEPFMSFLITLTSHHPYDLPDTMGGLELEDKDRGTLFGNYLRAMHYVDESLGEFIEGLKKKGLYEDTVIIIYGDHFGLNSKDNALHPRMDEFLGYRYDLDEMLKVPFIIHMPALEQDVKHILGGQIDFLPTVLHFLGYENTKNSYMLGQNLFSAEEGFVAQQAYMIKGSFMANNMIFDMSRDGIFEHGRAWNLVTKEVIPVEEARPFYEKAIEEVNRGLAILKQNPLADKQDAAISPKHPFYISHAGGRIKGYSYTNSLESIDNSLNKGLTYIEMDFIWTKDGYPVIYHDWGDHLSMFNQEAGVYTLEEYKAFEMAGGLQQMTLLDLIQWLEVHPEVFIITDGKEDNIRLMEYIAKNYPEQMHQFIPQIYDMDEYVPIRYMGYENIIFTLYKSDKTMAEVIDFINRNELFALTMPKKRAELGWAKQIKENNDIFIYAHTVNQIEEVKALQALGVDGFYTDDLVNSQQ